MKKILGVKITPAQGTIALICFIVAFVISLQIRSVVQNFGDVTLQSRVDILAQQLVDEKSKYEGLFAQAQGYKDKIDQYQAEIANGSAQSQALVDQLKTAEIAAGLVDVAGQGVIVTVNDTPSQAVGSKANAFIIHDSDLLTLVNELKNAGAEAVSINDERIAPNTSIRCVGNNVQINGQTKVPPFVIKAIGDSSTLDTALRMPGGAMEMLGLWINITCEKAASITIPRYTYPINYQYASPLPAGDVTP